MYFKYFKYFKYRAEPNNSWIGPLSKTVMPGQQFTEFQYSPSETVMPGQQFTECRYKIGLSDISPSKTVTPGQQFTECRDRTLERQERDRK